MSLLGGARAGLNAGRTCVVYDPTLLRRGVRVIRDAAIALALRAKRQPVAEVTNSPDSAPTPMRPTLHVRLVQNIERATGTLQTDTRNSAPDIGLLRPLARMHDRVNSGDERREKP